MTKNKKLTVRITPELERVLAAFSKSAGLSKNAIVIQALRALLKLGTERTHKKPRRPAEQE